MDYDLNDVLKRMMAATHTNNHHQLGKYFGKTGQLVSNWIKHNKIPTEHCFIIYENEGVTVEWLITGREPLNRPLTEEMVIDAWLKTVNDAVSLNILNDAEETSAQTLRVMGKSLYKTINQASDEKKAGVNSSANKSGTK